MAYNPTIWTNREVEKPRTYIIIDNPDGTKTLVPAEGTVTEPGTPITAANMNNIESQLVILDGFTQRADNPHNVTTTQVTFIGNIDGNSSALNYPMGVSVGTAIPENNFPAYGSVMTMRAALDVGGVLQLLTPHSSGFGTKTLIRMGSGRDGTWNGPFEELVTSKLPPRINAILNAGWTDDGIKFYKDSFGVVHVNGYVAMGASPSHSITDFPVGYRPTAIVSTGAYVFEGGAGQTGSCRLIVGVDGSLKYFLMPSFTVSNILLDFSFRTD